MFEGVRLSEQEKERYQKILLEKRILVLQGEITEEKAGELRALLGLLWIDSSKKEIKLYIDSSGGEVMPGLWLYDAIKLSPAPVIGIVNGQAGSTAVVVLQACERKQATAHSTFYLHKVRKEIPIDDKEIEKALEDGKEMQNRVYKILSEATGRSKEEIESKEDSPFWSEQAKDLGLIDEVIDQ